MLYAGDKNLPVTDFASACRPDDGIDTAINISGFYHHLNFDFRQKVDHVFRAPVQLGMSLLTAEAFDFSDC